MNTEQIVKFQKPKILKALKQFGKGYTFKRQGLNEYGEKSGEESVVTTITGIYHETNDRSVWLALTGSEAAKTISHKSNMILVRKEDFDKNPIQVEDTLEINSVYYKVNGVTNLWEANFAMDISIEEVV